MAKKITTDGFISRARSVHGNRYNYSRTKCIKSRESVIIICRKHGQFPQSPDNHLQGRGCPECSHENQRTTTKDFIRRSSLVHGNRYNYSPTEYGQSNKTKVKIICRRHGIFEQSPSNHLKGIGCPSCGKTKRLNTKGFVNRSIDIHGDRYDYSRADYRNNCKEVEIICKKHGIFKQIPANHLNGNGCPRCINRVSKPEIQFLDYLKIPYEKANRQKRIDKFKIDGYDDKTNTIYEFLGDYYHGNPNIYRPNAFNARCHKTHGKLYQKTFQKLNKLKSMGYIVKYIWESDWKAFKNGSAKTLNLQTA
jgi:hypothetical protein